jgi:hypothetical protein
MDLRYSVARRIKYDRKRHLLHTSHRSLAAWDTAPTFPRTPRMHPASPSMFTDIDPDVYRHRPQIRRIRPQCLPTSTPNPEDFTPMFTDIDLESGGFHPDVYRHRPQIRRIRPQCLPTLTTNPTDFTPMLPCIDHSASLHRALCNRVNHLFSAICTHGSGADSLFGLPEPGRSSGLSPNAASRR